ncbi:APC family permease [Glaciimonas soli]|uniref:Amino acid permease n=1 Tax=Glaciimonas soli TaxID=2590999 RepID=A0A843YWA3_9BURK|nr:APC family permease [Glaciimonas soli]MQR01954.1 amino acid permease [Glaciimonas soli]
MTTASPNEQGSKLKRELSYRDLVFYGLAYTAPVTPLTMAGFVWVVSGGLPVMAYLLCALCLYFTANSYAVMTSAMPSAGSVYNFASKTMGPFAGFISGWMILLDYLLVPAFTYTLAAVGLEQLMPQVDRETWVVIVVAVTTLVNWFGVSVTALVSSISVILQLLLVAVIVGLLLFALHGGMGNAALTMAPLFDASKFHVSSMLAATAICVTGYLGFDAVSTLAEEVKDRDTSLIGKAILTNLAVTSSLFVLVTWVIGNVLTGFPISDPATVIYDLTTAIGGKGVTAAMAWFMILVVGVPNVLPMQVGVARVLYAMGRDKTLPSVLAKVNRRHGNPYVAMIFSTAVSLAIALFMSERISDLAILISFGALSGFVFVHLSVLAHFGRRPGRSWWSHLAAPLIGIGAVVMIVSNLSSMALTVGICWCAAGIVYWLAKRYWNGAVDISPSESGSNPDASEPPQTTL